MPLKSGHKTSNGVENAGISIPKDEQYTPVSLFKVPGPEQFKQEWIASKGVKSYKKVMQYIKGMAKKRRSPMGSILAGVNPD